jgi:hypothetical protein
MFNKEDRKLNYDIKLKNKKDRRINKRGRSLEKIETKNKELFLYKKNSLIPLNTKVEDFIKYINTNLEFSELVKYRTSSQMVFNDRKNNIQIFEENQKYVKEETKNLNNKKNFIDFIFSKETEINFISLLGKKYNFYYNPKENKVYINENENIYLEKFKIQYNDKGTWKDFETYKGNTDRNTEILIFMKNRLVTNRIRIIPISWKGELDFQIFFWSQGCENNYNYNNESFILKREIENSSKNTNNKFRNKLKVKAIENKICNSEIFDSIPCLSTIEGLSSDEPYLYSDNIGSCLFSSVQITFSNNFTKEEMEKDIEYSKMLELFNFKENQKSLNLLKGIEINSTNDKNSIKKEVLNEDLTKHQLLDEDLTKHQLLDEDLTKNQTINEDLTKNQTINQQLENESDEWIVI